MATNPVNKGIVAIFLFVTICAILLFFLQQKNTDVIRNARYFFIIQLSNSRDDKFQEDDNSGGAGKGTVKTKLVK